MIEYLKLTFVSTQCYYTLYKYQMTDQTCENECNSLIDANKIDLENSTKLKTEDNKSTQYEKFTKRGWGKVEERYDELTMNVLEVLSNLGANVNSKKNVSSNIGCCGNEVYVAIRDKLVKLDIVRKKTIKLKTKKRWKRKEK